MEAEAGAPITTRVRVRVQVRQSEGRAQGVGDPPTREQHTKGGVVHAFLQHVQGLMGPVPCAPVHPCVPGHLHRFLSRAEKSKHHREVARQ